MKKIYDDARAEVWANDAEYYYDEEEPGKDKADNTTAIRILSYAS